MIPFVPLQPRTHDGMGGVPANALRNDDGGYVRNDQGGYVLKETP